MLMTEDHGFPRDAIVVSDVLRWAKWSTESGAVNWGDVDRCFGVGGRWQIVTMQVSLQLTTYH